MALRDHRPVNRARRNHLDISIVVLGKLKLTSEVILWPRFRLYVTV